MNAAEFAFQIKGAKQSGDQWSGCCPPTTTSAPAYAWRDANGHLLVKCQADCSFDSIVCRVGLEEGGLLQRFDGPWSPPFISRSGRGQAQASSKLVRTYDFTDEHGKILFQEVRLEPKGFYFRRPDGQGGWIKNLDGVTSRPLYRLHDLRLDHVPADR